MTKAELIAALAPYPDDIVIMAPNPWTYDPASSWPMEYEPIAEFTKCTHWDKEGGQYQVLYIGLY